jgi:hypothetical protein
MKLVTAKGFVEFKPTPDMDAFVLTIRRDDTEEVSWMTLSHDQAYVMGAAISNLCEQVDLEQKAAECRS